MNDKEQFLTQLKEEFSRWEELLSNLSEEQIIARQLPSGLFDQGRDRPFTRLAAAFSGQVGSWVAQKGTRVPKMGVEIDEASDESPDRINAWIHATYLDESWPVVYRYWREGFLRFLELGEAIPEKDLLEPGRYPWMQGEPLSLVLQASYEHHHIEHLEPLLEWLHQDENS